MKTYREINNNIILFQHLELNLLRPMLTIKSIIKYLLRDKINRNSEAGVYLSQLRVIKPKSRVLAVGLGYGSTMITALKILDADGHYTVVEASEKMIRSVEPTLTINGIKNNRNYEIIHAYAGINSSGIYGIPSKDFIDINNYDFSILELDCEGAEFEILKNLTKNTEYIIVELHPWAASNPFLNFDSFNEFMNQKKYEFCFAYGHDGDDLSLTQVDFLYSQSLDFDYLREVKFKPQNAKTKNLRFTTCPIVVTYKHIIKKI
jgi:hypothetical protein